MKLVRNKRVINPKFNGKYLTIKMNPKEPRLPFEVPYISYDYFNPQPYDTEEVIIPLYFTDYYQKEWVYDYTGYRFKLRVELDGEITYYDNLPAGDYNLNLGVLPKGEHWFSVQVIDEEGVESARLVNELLVLNKAEQEGAVNAYTMTPEDITTYGITLNMEQVDDIFDARLLANRDGLTNLFADKQKEGFTKIIMQPGTYRLGMHDVSNSKLPKPVIIPDHFTVDMNGAIFKQNPYNDNDPKIVEKWAPSRAATQMVAFYNTVDGHICNGTLEGDYAERSAVDDGTGNNWIKGGNGEFCQALRFLGGKYCTMRNMKVTQVTGYNVGHTAGGPARFGKGVQGSTLQLNKDIDWKTGEVIDREGFIVSVKEDLYRLVEEADEKYLTWTVWLAMGGIKGLDWTVDYFFYDKDNKYICHIRGDQYRRVRIPDGAKFVMTSIYYPGGTEVGSVGCHNAPFTRYSGIYDCEFVDNRTCVACCQHQHFIMTGCKFTRSGQGITPCEVDLEDGWEQQQDFFFIGNEILENVGTADVIDNAGINHVYRDNKNVSITLRYRIRGATVANNIGGYINNTIGFMTKNTIRIFNNEMELGFVNCTNKDFYNMDRTRVKYKNNFFQNHKQINEADEYLNEVFNLDGNKFLIKGYSGGFNLKDSEVLMMATGDNYMYGDRTRFTNCNFSCYEGPDQEMIIHFNGEGKTLDRRPTFRNCTFNDKLFIRSHNIWKNSLFENCTFEKDVRFSRLLHENKIGDIVFRNCTFKGNLNIDMAQNNSYIVFEYCTINGELTYTSGDRNKENAIFIGKDYSIGTDTVEIVHPDLDPNGKVKILELKGKTDKSTLVSSGIYNETSKTYDINISSTNGITTNNTVIKLPIDLKNVENNIDTFYWDETKGHYCIDKYIVTNKVHLTGDEDWRRDVISATNATYRIAATDITSEEKPDVNGATNSIIKAYANGLTPYGKLYIAGKDKGIAIGDSPDYSIVIGLNHETIGYDNADGANFNNELAKKWIKENNIDIVYLVKKQTIDLTEMNKIIEVKCYANKVTISSNVKLSKLKVEAPYLK